MSSSDAMMQCCVCGVLLKDPSQQWRDCQCPAHLSYMLTSAGACLDHMCTILQVPWCFHCMQLDPTGFQQELSLQADTELGFARSIADSGVTLDGMETDLRLMLHSGFSRRVCLCFRMTCTLAHDLAADSQCVQFSCFHNGVHRPNVELVVVYMAHRLLEVYVWHSAAKSSKHL